MEAFLFCCLSCKLPVCKGNFNGGQFLVGVEIKTKLLSRFPVFNFAVFAVSNITGLVKKIYIKREPFKCQRSGVFKGGLINLAVAHSIDMQEQHLIKQGRTNLIISPLCSMSLSFSLYCSLTETGLC